MIRNYRKNNDENFTIYFLAYIVMPTIILQNLKLRLHFYVDKLKRQIILLGKLDQTI